VIGPIPQFPNTKTNLRELIPEFFKNINHLILNNLLINLSQEQNKNTKQLIFKLN
jgi:hypothetical protein